MKMKSVAVLALAATLTACAGTSKVMLGQPRMPIDASQVQIYSTPPPGSVEIAQLEASSAVGFGTQGQTDAAVARLKREAAALGAIGGPDEEIVVPIGVRNHVISADEFAGWVDTAKSGNAPINERRARLTAIAQREILRRSGKDDAWRNSGPLKSAITKAWPTQKPLKLVDGLLPGPKGKKRAWTAADQLLVDEANSMLNGSPFTYGHVVVDEETHQFAPAIGRGQDERPVIRDSERSGRDAGCRFL
jgi:hypothetical protein